MESFSFIWHGCSSRYKPSIKSKSTLQINPLNMRQISCTIKYQYNLNILMKFLNEIREISSLSKLINSHSTKKRDFIRPISCHSSNCWVGQNSHSPPPDSVWHSWTSALHISQQTAYLFIFAQYLCLSWFWIKWGMEGWRDWPSTFLCVLRHHFGWLCGMSHVSFRLLSLQMKQEENECRYSCKRGGGGSGNVH